MPRFADRVAALVVAGLILVFGLLPWANWIPGGHSAEWYSVVAADWLNGTFIAVGGGLVLAILSRRLPLWRTGALQAVGERYEDHPGAVTLGLALGAGLLYAVVARVVFSGRPLLIDEMIQVFQGRIFAHGHLWRVAAEYPEFFSSMHVIDMGGRVYGQFPAGGPAMLMLGTLVGAEWLVGPVSGAISVVAFGYLIRRVATEPSVRLGAIVLFAFAPFTVFMAGSYMNHVTGLTWLLIAVAALAAVVGGDSPRPRSWAALLCGLGLGVAATIRPADALAFALPAGSWLLWRALRLPGRWRDLVASGVGVALPVGAMLWINSRTTGDPLLFGYTVLWGNLHALGFHAAPWGMVHTPLRGLELVNLYFLRLQTYLFETPFPALLPAAAALILSRRLRPLDRYLLVSGLGVVGLYFAYWHDGFYLGPRFMYPLIPVLAVWTARLPAIIRRRWPDGRAYRTTIYSYGIAALIAVGVSAPLRARAYAAGMLSPRWDADAAAARAGIHDALVLVRESWGAQQLARLWALGISRPHAELLYRSIDRCRLERGIAKLEASGTRGEAALAELMPLTADSAVLVKAQFSTDPTARYQPGAGYGDRCRRRVAEEQQGFAVYPPLLLAGGGGNVYARDLHARDSLLLRAYPGRAVYLLKPPSTKVGAEPLFYPVARDSLYREWSEEERF